MEGESSEAMVVSSRQQQWDAFRSLVQGLEEERDLEGLASIAEKSLMGLRQLCERPVTCTELDQLLDGLRQLKLDAFELGEEN